MKPSSQIGTPPEYMQVEEQKRLNIAREEGVPWKKWEPYLSERQWGTVREDYSEDGNAWDYFTHDQSRSRASLADWSLAAVATVQPGDVLTIIYTNSKNVFGISQDRAQLSGSCTPGQIVTSGSVQSKLNDYFNVACFRTPPIIGADGIGTAFGNSATGVVTAQTRRMLTSRLSGWSRSTGRKKEAACNFALSFLML